MSKTALPVWFYESFHFVSPDSELDVSKLTAKDIEDEAVRIKGCKSLAEYLRLSRTGATFKMERSAKTAFWRVIAEGVRW